MTNATTTSARVRCEVCGRVPRDRYVRDATARAMHAPYRKRRAVRQLVYSLDELERLGMADRMRAAWMGPAAWAGKRVCPDCWARLYAVIG